MTEENKLEKSSPIADMFKPKKYGIGAKREAAKKILDELDPQAMNNKLAIIFDDSGSMGGQKIKDAHAGVRGFSTQCIPTETSLAVYPLNAEPKPLTCNYDLLNILVSSIQATGGTPLYGRTQLALSSADKYDRLILFSDGDPTDSRTGYGDEYTVDQHEVTIKIAVEKKIPLDTVYIGIEGTTGYDVMKDLADRTGGIFIHFKDASSLASGLKYLSPGLRGLLANPEIKAKIERGEVI
jgi:Mg-chelatase subunit ChlD